MQSKRICAGGLIASVGDHFDFGDVAVGTVMASTINIKNTAEYPIQIIQLRPACKCTSANVGETVVPPGSETTLSLKLEGKKLEGEVTSGIIIEWRKKGSADQPRLLQVKLDGRFVSPFSVIPDTLNIEVDKSRKIQQVVVAVEPGLVKNDMRSARVEVDAPNGGVQGSFEMVTSTEGLLNVVIDPNKMYDGLNREEIRLAAYKNGAYVGFTPIGVAVGIDGNVHADVRQLIVAVGRQRPTETRTLILSTDDGRPFNIEALYSDVPWLTVNEARSEMETGTDRRVDCRITDEGNSQIGHIFVMTNGGDGSHTLRIPVLRSIEP
jgi:hypothetical protein